MDVARLVITQQQVGRRVVVDVAGEVDVATTPQLRETCLDVIAGGASEIWLDLSAVEFMDSTGLKVLLGLWRFLDDLGRRLAVIGPRRQVLHLLELSGVADRLDIFVSRAAAHHGF